MAGLISYTVRRPTDRSISAIFQFFRKRRYLKRISALHGSLGIMHDYGERHSIAVQWEANRLVSIGPDIFDREQFMAPGAAGAWRSMVAAAASDDIELQVVSAFRSFDYQEGIIRRKLEQGQDIGDILRVSAPPGFSEHHTGRALDLTTPGYAVLEEEFENSPAFGWLSESASRFGFCLSFPRGNPHRVAYEPWHWAWRN